MKDEIIHRIKQGDRVAFELIYRKYFQELCVHANKYLQNNELAVEMVQDVFLNLWNNRHNLDATNILQSYLYISTRNRSLNQLEKLKVEKKYKEIIRIAHSAYLEPITDVLENNELEEQLVQGISNLPPKCREVFLLSRQEGKKNKEIAEELNISVKTVENQITKALKVLRSELKDYLTFILLFF